MAVPTEMTVREGARVTVAYLMVFLLNIIFQVYAKTAAIREGKKMDKKGFNRYSSENKTLLAADRVVGNFNEWGPFFLSLFWINLYFNGVAKVVPAGYAYVLFRIGYLILAANGGITRYGPRQTILLATIPMYIVLLYLLVLIVPHIK